MSCRRVLAVALVAAWLLPAAMATAVGLHLDDHHGDDHHGDDHHGDDHELEHAAALGELADALGHGHAHEVGVPEHDHRAVQEPVRSLRPDVATAVARHEPAAPSRPVARLPIHRARDRPPPVPLFTLHCALLS